MPEGDTIFRAARALDRILAGKRITSFESPLPALTRAGLSGRRRSGEPCRRCGAGIRMRRQGDAARSTYGCPKCQPPSGPPGKKSAVLRDTPANGTLTVVEPR
ncbi:MAG TPA: zinc finger domain-containing protein [Thermoanaerobaculia bacterium]|nr:zinc finger domain-containing protein [Thermoanaerobaculia bacterium]